MRIPPLLAPLLLLQASLALADGGAVPAQLSAAVLEPPAGERSGDVAHLPETADHAPTLEQLQARGATIGDIRIQVENVFNEADPAENNALYRMANKLHLRTRPSTVEGQLLFKPGDPLSLQQTEETARILRTRHYLSDASVESESYDPDTNTVDLNVRVRDVWSLSPGISFGRSGGTNKTRAQIVDENFLGLGEYLALGYASTVDRSGVSLDFRDPHFLHSWWAVNAGYADNSDGYGMALGVGRPFYSLDTRWSAGTRLFSRDQTSYMWDLGEKTNDFRQQDSVVGIEGGWSRGLVNGWTTRWLAGYRYDRSTFEPITVPGSGEVPTLELPEDHTFSYPWVGVEVVQDHFVTTVNQDQIGRIEDLFVGLSARLELGWAPSALGSDPDAGIFALSGQAGRFLGQHGQVYFAGSYTGRLESGSPADAILEGQLRYYYRFNDKNLFMASTEAAQGYNLDLENQILLGGDNGLRGYPLRYQNGDTRALFTVEERYFSDWFPFHLVHVGGALFADAGRTWGDAPLSAPSLGWLYDVGFGLRLGNARSSLGNVLHVDLAFPLAGSEDISSVQLLLKAQKSF